MVEVYGPKRINISFPFLGKFHKNTEKFNDHWYYQSEHKYGVYGIWWHQSKVSKNLGFWVIGQHKDKGAVNKFYFVVIFV